MLEYTVYAKLTKAARPLPFIDLYRVENRVRHGLPDFHVQVSGGDIAWVEVKVIRGNRIKLERSQVPFLTKFAKRAGLAMILAVKPKEWIRFYDAAKVDLKQVDIREWSPVYEGDVDDWEGVLATLDYYITACNCDE